MGVIKRLRELWAELEWVFEPGPGLPEVPPAAHAWEPIYWPSDELAMISYPLPSPAVEVEPARRCDQVPCDCQ